MYSPSPTVCGFWYGVARAGMRPLAALMVAASLAGCVPVLMGGAVVGTTAVATDRRTAGIQLEDKTIDARVRGEVSAHHGDKVQVTPSSYNRKVLLVGTVPDEATRNHVGRLAAAVENVQEVNNQLTIGLPQTFSSSANDSLISSQVRAAFIGTNGLPSNALVITTHRNVVYLQGRVSQAEGDTAARVAAGLKGVGKVVKIYEYISDEEATRTSSKSFGSETGGQAPAAAAAPASSSYTTSASPQSSSLPAGGGAQVIPIPLAP